jgi:hypothetical protein
VNVFGDERQESHVTGLLDCLRQRMLVQVAGTGASSRFYLTPVRYEPSQHPGVLVVDVFDLARTE